MSINQSSILDEDQKQKIFGDKFKNQKVFFIKKEKIIEERCDELDNELESSGYEIIHREYITVATSIFNYEVYFIGSVTRTNLSL